MSLRSLLSCLPLLALTAACAPWQAPPTGPDPFAAARGHDVYGVVVATQPDAVPDMRLSTLCVGGGDECQTAITLGGTYEYATVQLSGKLTIDRAIVSKGISDPGDIVRLRMPRDRTVLPTSLERAAKAGDRRPQGCDWVDGSPQAKTGGVVCKGWSYRQLEGGRG